MTGRRLKFWGWGFEDQQPPHGAGRAGRGRRPRAPRIRPGAGASRRPRLEAWSCRRPASSRRRRSRPICRSDPYERALHAYGKLLPGPGAGASGPLRPPARTWWPTRRDEAELERVLAWCEEAGRRGDPLRRRHQRGGRGRAAAGPRLRRRGDDRPRGARPGARGRPGLARRPDPGRRHRARASRPSSREHGLTLRHFPQSFEYSTLGGWIATRAGRALRHARTRTSTTSSSPCGRSPRAACGRAAACPARAPGPAPTGS